MGPFTQGGITHQRKHSEELRGQHFFVFIFAIFVYTDVIFIGIEWGCNIGKKEFWVIQPLNFGYHPLFSQKFPIIYKIIRKILKEKRKLRASEEFCWLLYWPLWKCRKSDLNSNTKHPMDILESPFPWLALFSYPESLSWGIPIC